MMLSEATSSGTIATLQSLTAVSPHKSQLLRLRQELAPSHRPSLSLQAPRLHIRLPHPLSSTAGHISDLHPGLISGRFCFSSLECKCQDPNLLLYEPP